jgi:hypothetical protein
MSNRGLTLEQTKKGLNLGPYKDLRQFRIIMKPPSPTMRPHTISSCKPGRIDCASRSQSNDWRCPLVTIRTPFAG